MNSNNQQQNQERELIINTLNESEIRSEFLREYFDSNYNPVEYDPRDSYGRKLSGWRPGDTVLSVTIRKSLCIFKMILDPDTYQKKTFKEIKKLIQLYDTYIFLSIFMMSVPFNLFIPYVLPRIRRAKTEYFMHQYQKQKLIYINNILNNNFRIFSNILGLKNMKMRLHQMKKILKSQDKYNQ